MYFSLEMQPMTFHLVLSRSGMGFDIAKRSTRTKMLSIPFSRIPFGCIYSLSSYDGHTLHFSLHHTRWNFITHSSVALYDSLVAHFTCELAKKKPHYPIKSQPRTNFSPFEGYIDSISLLLHPSARLFNKLAIRQDNVQSNVLHSGERDPDPLFELPNYARIMMANSGTRFAKPLVYVYYIYPRVAEPIAKSSMELSMVRNILNSDCWCPHGPPSNPLPLSLAISRSISYFSFILRRKHEAPDTHWPANG